MVMQVDQRSGHLKKRMKFLGGEARVCGERRDVKWNWACQEVRKRELGGSWLYWMFGLVMLMGSWGGSGEDKGETQCEHQ